MNTKKLVTLGVILAVAVVIIVVVNALSNRGASEKALQLFPGITEKTIGAVTLKDALDRVKIQRKGDVWVMVPNAMLSSVPPAAEKKTSGLDKAMETDTGAAAPPTVKPPVGLFASEFPADSSAVAQLLDNIVKMKKDILISENPARQADFEVNADRGNRIEVFDIAGKSRGTVILGKSGESYNSAYFRPENSNEVYRVHDLNRWAFGTDHKRWADKQVMKFDKEAVSQLSIARKGVRPVVLEKSFDTAAPGWSMLKPAPLDVKKTNPAASDEVLNLLSNLVAAEIEDSAYTDKETGLADPSLLITVTFKSGTIRSLAVGNVKPDANKYWIRVPEKQYVYLLGEFEQKKLDKKVEEFKLQPGAASAAASPKIPDRVIKKAPERIQVK
ncbi:MAG: DUF4340 domain-containing protein [Chitinispirillaceae bacterium]|nr:DUF4340 domain-containing protein [Chitinispirillaceae bacterium]